MGANERVSLGETSESARRRGLTANEPGALRAAVHEAPRYKPKPSSRTIWTKPRERNASGLVLRAIQEEE